MTPQTFWHGINLNRLAKDLNISRQAVQQWTRREKGVPAERVAQVAKALGVEKKTSDRTCTNEWLDKA